MAADGSGLPPSRQSLARLDSTDRLSTRSVVSVPVTGSLPYGNLRVHQPPEPGPAEPAAPPPLAAAAAEILEQGDVFLLLDLPQGFLVGCDTTALTTRGARPVLGFRGIPPGAHLVFASDPAGISRCGYWFVAKEGGGRGAPRVKQWDRYNEVLGEPASRVEARSHVDDLASAYPNLVPYGHGHSQAPPGADPALDDGAVWRRLTSCITEALLGRVTGNADSSTAEWLVDTADSAKGELNFAQASELFKAVTGSELSFLFPPQDSALELRLLGVGAGAGDGAGSGRGAAEAAARPAPPRLPDTSLIVQNTLDGSEVAETELTGELQFVFLTAVHLGNPSCADYWFHLVIKIMLRAHRLVVSRPALVRSFILTVHAQLVYGERHLAAGGGGGGGGGEDGTNIGGASNSNGRSAAAGEEGGAGILDMAPQHKGRLREALTVYKRMLNESLLGLGDAIAEDQAAVGQAFSDLEAWFWKYGWDLRSDYAPETLAAAPDRAGPRPRPGLEPDPGDSDDDEYQPVLVDLDDNGRERGLVSWNF